MNNTLVGLIKSLAAEIRDASKSYTFSSELERDKEITVYAQEIPDTILDDERDDEEKGSYYPLILVALQSVGDDLETAEPAASVALVGLTIGTYGEDGQSWIDLMNLSETIRRHLLSKPIIANGFRLVSNVEMNFIERQPHPYHFGYMSLKYVVPQSTPPQIEWS